MSRFLADLLAHAKRLLAAKAADDVLMLTCQELQRLTGSELVYGSVGSSTSWASGPHRRFQGVAQSDATPPERSALFAAQRTVARERAPVVLDRTSHSTILEGLQGPAGEGAARAYPILHPHGRLSGCLVFFTPEQVDGELAAAVAELAALAGAALDNVQRISSARRDRERLSLLAEAAEEALWDWTPGTGAFWWGGGVQTLIGDVVVQSRLSWMFEQIHAEDVELVRESFERSLGARDAETWRAEYRLRRSDGSWILVENRAHIMRDSAGVAHRLVGALRDLTELRTLLKREQVARAEAESASLAKDEFLAMLGHELRNPLSPIVTALHILRKRGVPELVEQKLAVIERQARHLTRLVDDLLDVARIAKGKVLLERERIDLGQVIEAAIEAANPLIEERVHIIEAHVADGLLVDADRARMQQVIGNLITNAAKYTPPGGRITVTGYGADGLAHVSVADTGIGISAQMLPLVFETFVQARQTIDRTRGGLGLGLAIVRNLVRLHGGEVEARSEGEGKGSQFLIRIPFAAALHAPDVAGEAGAPVEDDVDRVLVVDDNSDAAQSLAELLGVMGYVVRVVHDGPAALAAVAEFVPDVVLLDIGLPKMDGYEVARRLREDHGQGCPRLIAVTGYGQANDRRRSREAGFDVHLVKPVPFDALRKAIVNFGGPSSEAASEAASAREVRGS